MQVYRTGSGFVSGQTAGQQRRKHPSQHIPAAAPGKPRVAGGVHAHPPVRACHHGVCPFEHHHGVPRLGIVQGDALPVGGKFCRRKPGQPRHLAGVRGDYQLPRRVREGFALGQQLGGGVQAVCVQHRSPGKAGQKLLHQRAGLGGPGGALRCAAKAGAQQQYGSLLPPEQRHIFRRNAALCALLTGAQAALRQTGDGGADHRFHTGKGNDTRPGAQCTLGCQQRSAPVKGTARHRQHAAKGTLMAVSGTGRDALPDKFFGNFHSHGCTSRERFSKSTFSQERKFYLYSGYRNARRHSDIPFSQGSAFTPVPAQGRGSAFPRSALPRETSGRTRAVRRDQG